MSLKHSLREGAVSVEHKSGDLLVPCILRFLRTIGRLIGLLHVFGRAAAGRIQMKKRSEWNKKIKEEG